MFIKDLITFAISSISLFVNVIPESTRLLLRVLYPASKGSFGMLIIALRGSFVGDFLNEFFYYFCNIFYLIIC